MSADHTVTFLIAWDGCVRAEFACHAGPDARCRCYCACPISEGDAWHDPAHNKPGRECIHAAWMDSDGIEYYAGDGRVLPASPAPIAYTWEGDYWSWDFTDQPTDRPAIDTGGTTPMDLA